MIYIFVMLMACLGAAVSIFGGVIVAIMGWFVVGPLALVAFFPSAAGVLGFIAIHEWAEREYFES